jgi:hypothetical protein
LISIWSRRPAIDYAIAGALVGGYRLARTLGLEALVVQPPSERGAIYQSALEATGAILAFAVIPAAIVLALTPGRRLGSLMRKYPHELRRATVAAAFASLGSMALCLGALSFDAGSATNILARYLVAFGLTVTFLAAVRLVDLFAQLLKSIGRDTETAGYDVTVGQVTPVERPELPDGVEVRLQAKSTAIG